MKILHFADIHAREKDLEEVQKCCEKVRETAQYEEPDLIVIAGDIYDDRAIRLDTDTCKFIFRLVSDLAEVAAVAIVTGTPYHEGQATESLVYASNIVHNVAVSAYPEQWFLSEGRLFPVNNGAPKNFTPDLLLSMVPTPTKQFFHSQSDIKGSDEELAGVMSGVFAGFGAMAEEFDCPHVLIGHFSVRGAAISDTQVMIGRDIEIGKDQISLANADIVLLGHIHKYQFIEPNIYYSGSLYHTKHGEAEAKGFMLHDIQPEGRESHFIETPTQKLMEIRTDLTEVEPEQFFDDLDAMLYKKEVKGSLLRVEYKVWQDQADSVPKEKIEQFFKSAGAKEVDIKLIRIPRENVRSERVLKLETLREKIEEQASLKSEEVTATVLTKADMLESLPEDQIIASLASA